MEQSRNRSNRYNGPISDREMNNSSNSNNNSSSERDRDTSFTSNTNRGRFSSDNTRRLNDSNTSYGDYYRGSRRYDTSSMGSPIQGRFPNNSDNGGNSSYYGGGGNSASSNPSTSTDTRSLQRSITISAPSSSTNLTGSSSSNNNNSNSGSGNSITPLPMQRRSYSNDPRSYSSYRGRGRGRYRGSERNHRGLHLSSGYDRWRPDRYSSSSSGTNRDDSSFNEPDYDMNSPIHRRRTRSDAGSDDNDEETNERRSITNNSSIIILVTIMNGVHQNGDLPRITHLITVIQSHVQQWREDRSQSSSLNNSNSNNRSSSYYYGSSQQAYDTYDGKQQDYYHRSHTSSRAYSNEKEKIDNERDDEDGQIQDIEPGQVSSGIAAVASSGSTTPIDQAALYAKSTPVASMTTSSSPIVVLDNNRSSKTTNAPSLEQPVSDVDLTATTTTVTTTATTDTLADMSKDLPSSPQLTVLTTSPPGTPHRSASITLDSMPLIAVDGPITKEKIFTRMDELDTQIAENEARLHTVRQLLADLSVPVSSPSPSPSLVSKTKEESVKDVPVVPCTSERRVTTASLWQDVEQVVHDIYAANQRRATLCELNLNEMDLSTVPPKLQPDPNTLSCIKRNTRIYHQLKPAMVRAIAIRKSTVASKIKSLKHEYRSLWKKWQLRVEKLDRIHNNSSGGGLREGTPGVLGLGDGGDDYSFVTGRQYSRRTFHNPDAARSEAEFWRYFSCCKRPKSEIPRIARNVPLPPSQI
ncbi:hypothetical protein BDF22DRAFT_40446 [Syncephalis plumigaleata]|nr:hypothetical protein BDF22DRAFT_40446 [Syncephalis plumigaleata]